NEIIAVLYGAWLERSFSLSVAALGFSATVIGLAELAGEGLVMGLADRVGKRRVIAAGLLATALAYFVLPLSGSSLPLALTALFGTFIAFEFTIVSSLPLMSELAPAARGQVMTTNVAALALGRMLGDWVAGYLYGLGFFWAGLAAAAANLLALAVL